MKLTFVIPHKGRFDMLTETLASIAAQHNSPLAMDVIVVSQTAEIENLTLSNNPDLALSIYVRPASDTISALRNFGVTRTDSEFLAFLDADVYLSENWVEQMYLQLQASASRIIVSAMQICNADAPPLEKIRTVLSNAELDQDVAFLPGRNLFMRSSDFQRIGGFPEHLITCEDYYFTDKAARLGSLYYTSSAHYRHIGEDKEFSAMFKKEIWRGQSNIQSLSGRQIPLREIPSFIVPPAIVGLLIIALLVSLGGQLRLALLPLALALLPVMVYSVRLNRLARSQVKFAEIVLFYLVYFPARAIGTFTGFFKTIKI